MSSRITAAESDVNAPTFPPAIVRAPGFDIMGTVGVYFTACLTIFCFALMLGRVLGFPLARAAMLGLNSSYGNAVMMGIPIAAATFGQDGLPPLMAIIALHSAIMLPLAGVLIEIGNSGKTKPLKLIGGMLKSTVRNPVIMSIVIAFAWRSLDLPFPTPFQELTHLLGATAVPLALICLGGSLPAFQRRIIDLEATLGILLKLVALPALVWAVGSWAGLPTLPLAVAVTTGGMPTGANAFLLARRAEGLLEMSAAKVLLTTLLSIASLTALLHLLA
jgi:malonate transporter